jgi:hypothetical protein
MIMVLGVLFLLAIIISTFVVFSRLSYQASVGRSYAVRTELLAHGALNQVRTLLARDLEVGQEQFDHPRFDPWLASILTDNQGRFDAATGRGAVYRYVTRLDLADTGWSPGYTAGNLATIGTGAVNGGRVPDNVNMASTRTVNGVSTLGHFETAGNFADANRDGIPDYLVTSPNAPANWYYVDADGDGKADSVLTGIGGGVSFPDGTCAYMAVRVVDNAHLNPVQHSKWAPFRRYNADNWPAHHTDITDGRIDPTYLPDSFSRNGAVPTAYKPRPRHPHVSFQNLRNIGMVLFGGTYGLGDNPDGAGENGYLTGNGWSWDAALDRLTLSDSLYYAYEPGFDLSQTGPGRPTPWSGIPGADPSFGRAPTNAMDDRVDASLIPFGIEDDLALRTFSTDPSQSKYAQVYTVPFGTRNLRFAADPAGQETRYECNFMRVTSSVTRERTRRWMIDPNDPNGVNRILSTPFDLRWLLSPNPGANYDAAGRPSADLTAKLNTLLQAMRNYRILGRPGMGPAGPGGTSADVRRAQYLANLCEYIRPPTPSPTVPGAFLYVPTRYDFSGSGVSTPIYGLCRQPFLTEVIRDGGRQLTPVSGNNGGIAPGGTRTAAMWDTVRFGVELFNPYNTPIDLSRYVLEFHSVPIAGVTVLGPSLRVSLAPLRQIAPFGYSWIATDVQATVPGTGVPGTTGRLALNASAGIPVVGLANATQADAIRRIGPRVLLNLRCTATDNLAVLMDTLDSRPRNGATAYTSDPPLNLGYVPATYAVNVYAKRIDRGLDFSDWDGRDAAVLGSSTADVLAFVNAGFVNNLTRPIVWQPYRSGIYRPSATPSWEFGGPIYWQPPPTTTTGLWMAYWREPTLSNEGGGDINAVALDAWPGPGNATFNFWAGLGFERYTAGRKNAAQDSLVFSQPPVITQWNNFIFGTPFYLPNRGVHPDYGCRFVNLGELAHVATVGNGLDHCLTQVVAAASEYIRTSVTPQPGAITGNLQVYNAPVIPAAAGFPGDLLTYGGGVRNAYVWINFERELKFDIYEGVGMGANGMPTGDNARMLDLVSLYMGNGGRAGLQADFLPYQGASDALVPPGGATTGGATADAGDDYRATADGTAVPVLNANGRVRYREGKINMNTAPWLALRCLPLSREGRNDVADWTPWYSDAATTGLNVWFAESLAGTDGSRPATEQGYLLQTLNQTNPAAAALGIDKDPYYKDISDVFLFAQGANPTLAGRMYNRAGLGWDAMMYCGTGGWVYTINYGFGIQNSFPWVHSEYRRMPHKSGYHYPTDKRLPVPTAAQWSMWPAYVNPPNPYPLLPTGDPYNASVPGSGEQLEIPVRGQCADMSQRDTLWATCSNVVSTRSDVYTVYVLVKLIRPTPGTVQPATGREFEDLGETRLVAIVDRTNVVVDPATGRADLTTLPRVLGRMIVENP